MKLLTLLSTLLLTFSLNANTQTAKNIKVESRKLTLSVSKQSKFTNTTEITAPKLQTTAKINSDGSLHLQCDEVHNHQLDKELK